MKLTKAFGIFGFAAAATLSLAACNGNSGTPSASATPSSGSGASASSSVVSSSSGEAPIQKDLVLSGDYTYNGYTEALGDTWNPHTWEDSGDSLILGYLSVGLVDMSIKDSENQEYQWVYEMATSIKDVTKTHQSDLTKYKSSLPEGKTSVNQVESGYVFEIKLNQEAKWANGEAITADTYVESMKRLLDPDMLNYRANTYISGESAIAGAYQYYYSKTQGLYVRIGTEYKTNQAAIDANETIYIDTHEFWGAKGYTDAEGNECPQWVPYNSTTVYGAYSLKPTFDKTNAEMCTPYSEEAGYDYVELPTKYTDPTSPDYLDEEADDYEDKLGAALAETYAALTAAEKAEIEAQYYADKESAYYDEFTASDLWAAYFNPVNGSYKGYVEVGADYAEWLSIYRTNDEYDPSLAYDTVGLYKVDDYTINYVLKTGEKLDYFLTSMTSSWLVHPATYDASIKMVGGLKTSTYGTSLDTTMSYGPYKMTSFQAAKQVVFERDPYWYGYQKTADNYLYSITNFAVDGERKQQYITTKIIINVETKQTAKQKFFKGELDEWTPEPSEVATYNMSTQMYKVDESYTMRLFFNTNEAKIEAMETAGTNINGVVMTNKDFRKAFSLCINRADWVTTTEGYKPATYLINDLYYYNVFEDPTSKYRSAEATMKSIVDFYGYEYGEGKQYATLEQAYDAVTGYNLSEAKALMKKACDALVAAGKYTAGSPITLSLAWQKAPLDATANTQVSRLQSYLNAAIEGSGFGTITLTPVGGLKERYQDVEKGNYAIGYGAWGGAAFYPFTMFQLYMDPDHTDIHEIGCYDPTTETLTLKVKGQEVTKTWQAWSQSMSGTGEYANESFETKLEISAQLETAFLSQYYCIPLAGSTAVSMLSFKMNYYTEDYNIMYGFGGLRLMSYNYTDTEWAAYVTSQGGTLTY